MALSKPTLSRKSVTLGITLCLIGLGYGYYFFGYVKNNQKELNDKIFRSLDKVAANIVKKSAVIDQTVHRAKNNFGKEGDKKEALIDGNNKNDIDRIIQYLYSQGTNKGLYIAEKAASLKNINYGIENDQIDHIEINQKEKENEKDENRYVSIPLKEFLASILNNDIVDEYIILRNGSMAFQSLHNEMINDQAIERDSLGEFNVANEKYKRFDHRFEFGPDEFWVIIGLVKSEKYSNLTRSINIWLIINFFLFILTVVVAMPFLKLVFMNPIERLFRTNVFFSGLSFLFGIPLILLLLMVLKYYFVDEREIIDNNLESLSGQIVNSFEEELISSLDRIAHIEKSYTNVKANEKLEFDTSTESKNLLGPIKLEEENEGLSIYTSESEAIIKDFELPLNELYWMDENGDQRIRISKNDPGVKVEIKNSDITRLKHREYFSEINEGNGFVYEFCDSIDAPYPDPIFIQSIYSWRSGNPEVAVSKKSSFKLDSEQMRVAAITTRFSKVMNPILPLGYSYSIIDGNGDVLIHSDNKKNLQENFLDESNNDKGLTSFLFGKESVHQSIDYNHKKYNIYATTLGGPETSLFLVTMYNSEFSKYKISEIWSISLILFLGALFLLSFVLLVYYLMTSKNRKLLIQEFFFEWMTPKQELIKKYKSLTILNVVLTFVFFIFYYTEHDTGNQLFILFLIPAVSFVCTYFVLNYGHASELDRKIILKSVFGLGIIIVLMISFYIKYDFQDIIPIASILILIVLNFAPSLIKDKSNSLVDELNIGDNDDMIDMQGRIKPSQRHKYFKPYVIFLASWLLFSALMPMYLFFMYYSHVEEVLWEEYDMAKFELNRELQEKSNPELSYTLYHVRDSVTGAVSESAIGNAPEDEIPDEQSSWLEVIASLRPEYSASITENNGLITNVSAKNKKQKFKSWHIMRLMILMIFLYCIYELIIFCLYKIYGIGYMTLNNSDHNHSIMLKKKLKQAIEKKKNIILIGAPGTKKITFLQGLFADKEPLIIDFRKDDYFEEINDQYRLKPKPYSEIESFKNAFIILDNFEFDNDDTRKNDLKLEYLKKIKSMGLMVSLVIVTELQPSDVIDYHYRSIIDKSKGAVNEGVLKEYRNNKENWRQLLSNFSEYYLPLQDKSTSENQDKYLSELKWGSFLVELDKRLVIDQRGYSKTKFERKLNENVILSIQKHANSYYYGLWNSLSRNEKFIVYDLAYDGFVNTGNAHMINRLMSKGVVVFDERLKLMNRSFANFVLTIVKDGEVIEMNKEVKRLGKWGNMKQVIILVLISLIVLIGLGQPDFLKNINAIVLTIGGIISVIPSILGMVSGTKTSS